MSQADQIRRFAINRYITPARAKGLSRVRIRAGDIHRELSLANAMPAVCSALGGMRFPAEAGVTLLDRQGPPQGANVYFDFGLQEPDSPVQSQPSRSTLPSPSSAAAGSSLNLAGAIVLVSCVKRKLSHPAPARSLYCSPWFEKVRAIVDASGARWFVLSALHGLVSPETEIAPYDLTLNQMGIGERQEWARRVLTDLLEQIGDERRVVLFAGRRYRELLEEPLRGEGLIVSVPMEGLRQGEQLAWLSQVR